MATEYKALRFGNGEKTHIGIKFTHDSGKVSIFPQCGSRVQGTYTHNLGAIEEAEFLAIPSACDKCRADIAKRAAA